MCSIKSKLGSPITIADVASPSACITVGARTVTLANSGDGHPHPLAGHPIPVLMLLLRLRHGNDLEEVSADNFLRHSLNSEYMGDDILGDLDED